jgi:acetyl esterase/lipase
LLQIFKTNGRPIDFDSDVDIPLLRAHLKAVKEQFTSKVNFGEVSYVEEERQIEVRDGSSITIRIHSPKNISSDGCPVFVVFHGGGWVLGDLDNEIVLCRSFTKLGGVAVNVNYRLAPENPFPIPVEDAYDALKWVRRLPALATSYADPPRLLHISRSLGATPRRDS